MKSFLIGIVILVTLVVGVIAATLVKNQARFFEPPGLAKRLTVYLGEHTAATSDNHPFPELLTPVFFVEAEQLFNAVIKVASEQGWEIVYMDDENLKAEFIITTPLLRFKDDLVVQVLLKNARINSEESALFIRSSSRQGKADFAANAGHIQTLVQQIEQEI